MSERACGACGTANEPDARFCEGCGSALERRCASCGTAASATARFCKSCGGSLDAPESPAPEGPTRKTVTVLFADLAGSTTFEEKVDAETSREVMGHYHNLLRTTAHRHRAGVTKYIGDGFMAVWGVPEVSAADADRAVDAAVELQERFVDLAAQVAAAHGEDLALRVAVNTGEVVVGSGDADLVGDALNVAARLESQCPHGHVVVGEETWRATRGRYRYEPLSPVRVKGKAEPVAVYQWAGRRSEPADSIPFVGRSYEFRRLQAVLNDAAAHRAARLVTVIGDPGVGKTRLAAEFASSLKDTVVLQIRCAAEGTVALAPVVEVLRARDVQVDLPGAVPERDRILRDLMGMTEGVAGSVEETFWALRRYFEVLASHGRLILVLDDVQWADALLLDFVEHLSEWVRDVPMLMIALARPELRETRPELVTVGGWVGDAIRLGGLEPGATAELAARVLGSDQLPAELLSRLPTSTGGNPLFVRELVAMLVHDGVLVAQDNGWRLTIDVDAIAVPPTIQALLASRLERMNTSDRRVLETASVIGTDFSPAAVCALSGAGAAEVKASLDRLRRLELAQPTGAYTGDQPVWRFHHILIRDVAYRRLLKSDRADLHERFADWVRDGGQTGVFESDELLARHLESAYGYRCELGARDATAAELALRSARCYLSAARRALDRDALVSAGAQAARGAALATADPALRAELLLIGCEAYLSAGDVAAGAALVDELDRVADEALAPWAICYRCQHIVYTDPSRLPEVDERLQDAIDEFARRGDPAGAAKAYRVRASTRGRLGRIGEAEADLFEALIAARRCGDHRQITAALGAAPNAALWGPSPVPKAGGRCLDVVRMQRMTTAAPSLEATSLRCLAVLELLRGRPDKARSMLADAREIVSELGLRHGLMETELFAGIIESMAGDPAAAEPHFRTAMEGLDSLGVGADAGQAAALLARSLLAQGRIDEADHYAAESERIAGHNLKTAIGWRAARAEILSAQGRHQDAVAMARQAVDVAADTDLVLDYADACLTLSRVLAAAGDTAGAETARSRAESLYAAKDAVFLADQADPAPRASERSVATPRARLRLNTVNRATDVPFKALEGSIRSSDSFVYEDHRLVSGEPLGGGEDLHAAAKRKFEQYPHVEGPVLAVRGEGLALLAMHWWDDDGNHTTSLDLFEVNESGELDYHGRFDEHDLQSAYITMEERYYAGEGKEFAVGGLLQLEFQTAVWANDIEAARLLVQPDFVWKADPSTLKAGERSLDEIFTWRADRLAQVTSFQDWLAALEWLSPEVCVSLVEMRGEGYRWPRYYVIHGRDGLAASGREFGIENEDEAFAYAESLVANKASRLQVSNRASAVADGIIGALQSKDAAAASALYAEGLTYDDRRRLGGNPVASRLDYSSNIERLLHQYSSFDNETLAVRGERLVLVSSSLSDPAGNEAAYLHLFELDDDGLVGYEGRFDLDDFLNAYCELERRYYTGEGSDFAESSRAGAGWVEGINRRDIETVRSFSTPDFRWYASPSSLKATERTVEDIFAWMGERGGHVSSQRHWNSAIHFDSPTCAIGRCDISAVGRDGEPFRWNSFVVSEFRDGLLASVHEFDTEAEAFAYAEAAGAQTHSPLAVANRASSATVRILSAMRDGNLDACVDYWADQFGYDDRRKLSGELISTRAEMREALHRILLRYSTFECRTLAVRGDRINLTRLCWSDDDGNQSVSLTLGEVDDNDRLIYEGRFDEDDFEGAYLEMERRYYAGEGAPFAVAGEALAQMHIAASRGDLDASLGAFMEPGLRIESRSHSIFPTRTAQELRQSLEELDAMVGSYRVWNPAVFWLSSEWVVARHEREVLRGDGVPFSWARIYVGEFRDGAFRSVCEFDSGDELEALAYAEERMRAATSRLAVANRASAVGDRLARAIRQDGDMESALAQFAGDCVYEDRRRLSGDPIIGVSARRAALERVVQQYAHLEMTPVAVRGERLVLERIRRSDDLGNESTVLVLGEIDDGDRMATYISFDEDDFEGAYLELERRYYAGEGAAFAEAGAVLTKVVTAGNRGDIDRLFDEVFPPGGLVESRSRTIIPSRTLDEFRSSLNEFRSMVGSSRTWYATVCWLSPTSVIVRQEREAVGLEGQQYEWSRIYVLEIEDGRINAGCEFDTEFEDEAFAYAEDRALSASNLSTVTNHADQVGLFLRSTVQEGDFDAAAAVIADDVSHEDWRRLSGNPFRGRAAALAALAHLSQQYSNLEKRALAVRGRNLVLGHYRWTDEAGNESTGLLIDETGEGGQLVYTARFDEDDFETAYRELERRYYAGEGAVSAAQGARLVDFVTAINRGDLDSAFGLINNPNLRIETRSRAVFPDRSLVELRADLERLISMTSSVRWWYSDIRWVAPDVCVARQEREAIGPEGQTYAWTDIYAFEFRGDAVTWICRYELEDQDQAFADAEERIEGSGRLKVANRASATRVACTEAIERDDIDAAAALYSNDFEYQDHRRLNGDLPVGRAGIHAAFTRLRHHYSHYGGHFLAVRGNRLALGQYFCSDDAGNRTSGLSLTGIDEDGMIILEARFEDDDFDSAYAELERRYYADEGAPFTVNGMASANYIAAVNRGDFETAFEEFVTPDVRIDIRSNSVFSVRDASDYRAAFEELERLVGSVRDWCAAMEWITPNWNVIRYQRVAVGTDGEQYQWDRICVCEIRDGRLNYLCDFEIADEDAAFAYADERARQSAARLPLTNAASEVMEANARAMSAGDLSQIDASYRDDSRIENLRRWAAHGTVLSKTLLLRNVNHIRRQFSCFEWTTLAIRGQRSVLAWSKWSDHAGNRSVTIHVVETDGSGKIVYHGWFDEDDVEGAYRELDRRFYAGEGAAFATNGPLQAAFVEAANRRDLDGLRRVCLPSFRIQSPPTTLAVEERSLREFFRWIQERAEQAPSVRHWMSAVRWLSEDCTINRIEIRSLGPEGDDYSWPRLAVAELRGGRLAHIRQFDLDDEDAAFAYADEIVAKHATRLPSANVASEVAFAGNCAMRAGDIDTLTDLYDENHVFDDRRSLSGDPLRGREAIRAAAERIFSQFDTFQSRMIAVRGSRYAMGWSQWSDSAGDQSGYLHVFETGDDGRIVYAGRFDEDDFDAAYAELERRYYAGEGSAFAEYGPVTADYLAAMNRGDFDTVVGRLTHDDFRIVNRSRSAFPDRSAPELRASLEELYAMLASVRSWFSSISWVSPTTAVSRMEREGVGKDGEPYSWSRILVSDWRDGKLALLGDFDPDDDGAALAYAETL